MIRMMIDIETLDTTTTSTILTIGAVVFTDTEVLQQTYIELDYIDQLRVGRTVGKDTWKWWRTQDKEAFQKAFYTLDRSTPSLQAISILNTLYTGSKCKEMWAQGGDFDVPIITSWMKDYGKSPAWHFGASRDSRSVRKLFNLPEPPFKGLKHHALDDALYQVDRVQDCIRKLKDDRYTN